MKTKSAANFFTRLFYPVLSVSLDFVQVWLGIGNFAGLLSAPPLNMELTP
jgi:hypothetical protein